MIARNGDTPRTDWKATPPSEPESGATQLLTAEQVGQRFQIPVSQVYRLAREEKLPCLKIGKYRRFRIEALEEWEAAGGTD
jgi:excisionase family DNA binding protein